MEYVFVYGTLKQGFPNFEINQGTRLPGAFMTAERYPLYLVGERCVPWMVSQPGAGRQVFGEVFEVDDAALLAMDKLEGIGKLYGYRRQKIRVTDAESLCELSVFAYVKPLEQLDLEQVKLGPLTSYELQHASLYRKR